MWEASSDSYEQRHALALSGEKAMAWGMWRIPEEELHVPGEVDFQLTYGEWIRLFRRSGFVVEDLIEPQPPQGSTSTYRDEAETAWARR
jgi:hypothetical protein